MSKDDEFYIKVSAGHYPKSEVGTMMEEIQQLLTSKGWQTSTAVVYEPPTVSEPKQTTFNAVCECDDWNCRLQIPMQTGEYSRVKDKYPGLRLISLKCKNLDTGTFKYIQDGYAMVMFEDRKG
jgi:hypothetical protein